MWERRSPRGGEEGARDGKDLDFRLRVFVMYVYEKIEKDLSLRIKKTIIIS